MCLFAIANTPSARDAASKIAPAPLDNVRNQPHDVRVPGPLHGIDELQQPLIRDMQDAPVNDLAHPPIECKWWMSRDNCVELCTS